MSSVSSAKAADVEQQKKAGQPSASCLEEYLYWATLQRQEEQEAAAAAASAASEPDQQPEQKLWSKLTHLNHHHLVGRKRALAAVETEQEETEGKKDDAEKQAGSSNDNVDDDDEKKSPTISQTPLGTLTAQCVGLDQQEQEKLVARRALRIASASTVFFLITTDILGPNSAPYSLSQNGE